MKKAKSMAKLAIKEPLQRMTSSMKKDEVYYTAMSKFFLRLRTGAKCFMFFL